MYIHNWRRELLWLACFITILYKRCMSMKLWLGAKVKEDNDDHEDSDGDDDT